MATVEEEEREEGRKQIYGARLRVSKGKVGSSGGNGGSGRGSVKVTVKMVIVADGDW